MYCGLSSVYKYLLSGKKACKQGGKEVYSELFEFIILVVIMVLTQEELDHWNMDMLKNYLNERGISLSGGGSKKADLIRKVLAADLQFDVDMY